MSQKIVVGPVNQGLRTDRTAFVIDNDSFPKLVNAYQWRGRIRRKRGTSLLGRLTRFFNSNSTSYSSTASINLSSGAANILTGFNLQTNGNIVPGYTVITDTTATATYTDAVQQRTLVAATITGATQANPCVLTANNTNYIVGDRVTITNVLGMTELNGNIYTITAVDSTTITLDVDSTSFTAYIGSGTATNINVDTNYLYTAAVITGATQANPCVLTATNSFSNGDKVVITGVGGMTQLNGNVYTITARTGATITIDVDSTGFGAYTSGGLATDLALNNGTITYSTGAITITGGAGDTIKAQYLYYPDLPVMGIEDLVLSANLFPGTISFDTTYAYNINTASPYNIYDVSFYKNPASATINTIAYTQKTNATPVTWNGQTYQQFWTTNYENAFWATNGITIPFNTTNIGMQFKPCASVTWVSATNLTITITEASASLVIGDWVFINEVTGTDNFSVNLQTGFVTAVANAAGTTTLTVRFPYANMSNQVYANGILQYLTNRSDSTKDCIRWYDGDPTDGNSTSPTLTAGKGWVNFMPPISQSSLTNNTPDDVPAGQYYLVGARMIVPYKDRLLFIGPVIQTSATGVAPIYLQDTVIYSQNGTPYYTASFDGSVDGAVTSAATTFNPLLTPSINSTNVQSASPASFFSDSTGFGGYITAGHSRPIVSAGFNEDVLILGFSNRQTRFLYTGNDLLPFNFFTVNSEFGSTSTFSIITLDRAIITIGNNGIIQTSQISSERIDLAILDNVFQFNLQNNGTERITAQRDFINEWIYFTYCSDEQSWAFPNQTLQYNYREKSWAVFNEAYTTYGQFRESSSLTWATVGSRFKTWSAWNEPWNSGSSNVFQPKVVAGNQQGFIIFRDDGTDEAESLYIQSISGNIITSPAHTLNANDFITITINGVFIGIYQVGNPNTNTFTAIGPNALPSPYFGLGTIQRMYVPQILTKQFPVSWGDGRKTRIGPQQYLLSTTEDGQITLLIFLSQNSLNGPAYNTGDLIPGTNVINGSLIYSTVLYTSPESTNLGLTPPNVNLQMPTAINQEQIWHRINTSLIGDTIQLGFTMSDDQMKDESFNNQFSEIELHAFILNVSPSQVLA